RDLRRRRDPRQQRTPPGGPPARHRPARRRPRPRRRYRGRRGDRPQLVLHRRPVAPRVGDRLGAGPAALRVLPPGLRPPGPAVAARGLKPDKETRRQGENGAETTCLPVSLSPCLLVSPSPCPLVSRSPCPLVLFVGGEDR